MKISTLALALAAGIIAASGAQAQKMDADDLKWINQCIQDNRGGASGEVIRKYCVCMNEKMDSNETRTISQWEKANPAARRACDRASGWK